MQTGIIVFFISWTMAWLINRYSREVAAWFDIVTRTSPVNMRPEEYRRQTVRQTLWESFVAMPILALVMVGIYFLFMKRGGIADLYSQWGLSQLSVGERSVLELKWIRPLGFQNFVAFFLLSILLLAASLCDIRRKIIPDSVTIIGTAVGIGLSFTPWAIFIPVQTYMPFDVNVLDLIPIGNEITPLTFSSPFALPCWSMSTKILAACLCWLFFVYAYLYRPIKFKRFKRRFQLYCLRLIREPSTYMALIVALVGLTVTIFILRQSDIVRQGQVLSSLFGMTFGGLAVWAVRIVGRWSLKMEAIGFGDVTLMMAIGAFTGWQAIPVIFFLSPATGLFVGIVMLLCGQRLVPLGPFLCLTTALWFVCFDSLWTFCLPLYLLGATTVITILAICLALMAIMLVFIHFIKLGVRSEK